MKGLKGYTGWGTAGILTACILGRPAAAQVTFRLGEAVAPPGTARVSLPVSILIEPGGPPVYGWSAVWSYDPSVVTAVSIESPPPVMGTFKATTEVCTSARYGGHKVVNDTELSVDMIVIVCTGAGVVLGWVGSPSRLDDLLANFTFAPDEVSAP